MEKDTATSKNQPRILVLGYGNPNRRDDRVGWYIAEKLQAQVSSNVQVETDHQLEIEWAETIKNYDLVVFVDTHVSDHEDWMREVAVTPGYETNAISHHLTPATLMGFCQALYHQTPQGILYTVKGINFNFGTELSEKTQQAADEIILEILKKIKEFKVEILSLK